MSIPNLYICFSKSGAKLLLFAHVRNRKKNDKNSKNNDFACVYQKKAVSLQQNSLFVMNNEPNTVEMCLCINGMAEALINGERYDLQQGSLYLISPIVHVFLLRHSEDFALSTIVSSTDNLFPAIEPMYDAMIRNNLYQHPCTMLDRTRQLNFLAMEKRIRQKKEEMQTEPKEEVRKLMQQIIIQLQRTVILEILQLFLQQRTQVAKSATKSEQTTFQFLQTLHDNYKTERDVAFYAEQSGLTPNHFTHVVKQVTGRTPMDWISTFTILEAKRLLSRKGARVKDVAVALRFPDQYTFTRYFKTYAGMTPREFQTTK